MEKLNNNNCVFCNIIAKKENNFIILDDIDFLAFLDKRPVFYGHTLLVPKPHISEVEQLPNHLAQKIFSYIQKLAKAIEIGMHAEGTFVAINNKVSQSIPHLHVHLIPRNKGDGLKGFFWPRQKYEDEHQMAQIQSDLIVALKQIT